MSEQENIEKVQEEEEVVFNEPEPTKIVKKKRPPLTEKQLANLKAGREKAIERKKQISKEMDLKNKTRILREAKEKTIKEKVEKAEKDYEHTVQEVIPENKVSTTKKCKKKKVKVVYVSSSDSDDSAEEEIVYKKKSKQKSQSRDKNNDLVEKSSLDALRNKVRDDHLSELVALLKPC